MLLDVHVAVDAKVGGRCTRRTQRVIAARRGAGEEQAASEGEHEQQHARVSGRVGDGNGCYAKEENTSGRR